MTICVVSLSTASGLKLLSFLKRQTALAKTAEIFPPLLRLCQPGGNPLENGCRHADKLKPNALPLQARQQAERVQMRLVHLPPFVGCGGETSGEQESFVFAETGDFSQKSFHALPFFFTCRNVSLMTFAVNPARFRKISE